jgi:chemotaxis protein MotB
VVGIRPRKQAAEAGASWLVTFTDLTVLVLTFFVLLFSMSTVRKEHWDALVSTLADTLHPTTDRSSRKVAAPLNVVTTGQDEAIDLEYLASVLEQKMRRDELLGRAVLRRLRDRLVVSLPSDVLFAPGSAELDESARQALFVLSGVLTNVPNRVDVLGYTDPRSVGDPAYASNWELSLARAVAVAEELRRSGYRRRMVTLGLGDSRFVGLASSLPQARREALARRVDLVIRPSGDEQ